MQIFVFNLANQRLRRFTSGVIYADSYPYTVFKFNFNTPDWDFAPTKTAVFSYRGENYHEPLDENNMCKVPAEVLHDGLFYVSVYGGGLVTNKIRIPVMEAPKDIFPDDSGDNQGVVFVPEIDDHKILTWTIKEIGDELVTPPPTDLNPYDEWNETEDEVETEYIWESMQ